MMKKILVLLATHNGEKYLREQIESILNQKNVIVDILVSDDSSTDGTIEILNSYLDGNKLKYVTSKCGSAQKNFYNLINIANNEYDFYALSDQDDIWDENKLFFAVRMLEKFSHAEANLYTGVSTPVDSNNNKLNIRKYKHYFVDTFESAIIACNTQGCTMVFNNVFLNKVKNKETKTKIMHDAWLYKTCLVIGGNVVFDKIPHMRYRQHENNVFANLGRNKNFIDNLKSKIKTFLNKEQEYLRSNLIEEWKLNFGDQISNNIKQSFDEILLANNSIKNKFKIIFSEKFKSKYRKSYFKFIILILKGKI